MNQKNILTGFSIFGLVWTALTYLNAGKAAVQIFPELDEVGIFAVTIHQELMAMFILILSLSMFALRNSPRVVGPLAIAFLLITLNTMKHILLDGINLPMFGVVMQWVITGSLAYLFWKERAQDISKVTV